MRKIDPVRCLAALLLASALSLLVAADKADSGDKDDADKKEAKSDHDAIQGTWRCVKMERDGKEEAEDDVKGHELLLTFEGDKVSYRHKRDNGESETKHGTYKLESDKKPGHIVITPTEESDRDKKIEAIYEVKGDTLKVAHGRDDQAALPEDFKGGDGIVIMTLHREKAGDKDKEGKDEKK